MFQFSTLISVGHIWTDMVVNVYIMHDQQVLFNVDD